MRIGVFLPDRAATSMRICARNVMECLADQEITFCVFGSRDLLPEDVNFYWDPRSGNGNPPPQRLRFVRQPVVLTSHGVVTSTQYAGVAEWTWKHQQYYKVTNLYKKIRWLGFRSKIHTLITVSKYSAGVLPDNIGIDAKKIKWIHHGVDHSVFYPDENTHSEEPYLLHVSVGLKLPKNVIRILEAYESWEFKSKPRLRLILAGYKGELPLHPDGVELIREYQSQPQLAQHYQQASGFVFPSLKESFGMPIIEAMASGCPVITSRTTACGEIAADAALLIDPLSVQEITGAMQKLVTDETLRQNLRQRGLQRAQQFSWAKTAQEHLQIFQQV